MTKSRNNANCILCENKKCKGKESFEFIADNGCNKIVLSKGKKIKAKVKKVDLSKEENRDSSFDRLWDPGW